MLPSNSKGQENIENNESDSPPLKRVSLRKRKENKANVQKKSDRGPLSSIASLLVKKSQRETRSSVRNALDKTENLVPKPRIPMVYLERLRSEFE